MQKLPSSIKWLLVKRGRIDGSIQKIEAYLDRHKRQFEKYHQLAAELRLMKETLKAVDQTIQLHNLQIDPANIPSINGRNPITDMKRGELTQLIFEQLEKRRGEIVSSSELVDSILASREEAGLPLPARSNLRMQVKRRLQALCSQGMVMRHHPLQSGSYGLWTLTTAPFTQDIRTEDDALGSIP